MLELFKDHAEEENFDGLTCYRDCRRGNQREGN